VVHDLDFVPAEAAPLDFSNRTWTRLEREPSGLADLARVNGIVEGRNTVLARAEVRSAAGRFPDATGLSL
jgi:hypothetical protein